jgi:hypothetical protein
MAGFCQPADGKTRRRDRRSDARSPRKNTQATILVRGHRTHLWLPGVRAYPLPLSARLLRMEGKLGRSRVSFDLRFRPRVEYRRSAERPRITHVQDPRCHQHAPRVCVRLRRRVQGMPPPCASQRGLSLSSLYPRVLLHTWQSVGFRSLYAHLERVQRSGM